MHLVPHRAKSAQQLDHLRGGDPPTPTSISSSGVRGGGSRISPHVGQLTSSQPWASCGTKGS